MGTDRADGSANGMEHQSKLIEGVPPRANWCCMPGIHGAWSKFLTWVRMKREARCPKDAREACSPSSQLTSKASSSNEGGNLGISHTMSWSSLPYDMVGAILVNLSLIELARISSTCSSFQAVYNQRMGVLQKSRLDLATSSFGTERIRCIVALFAHLLSGKPLNGDFGFHEYKRCSISPDGVLQSPFPRSSPCGGQFNSKMGGFTLRICPRASFFEFTFTFGEKANCSWSYVSADMYSYQPGVLIKVFSGHDEDLQAVAMVQAMLSWGLAQYLHDEGKWAKICIVKWGICGNSTVTGLKAQILPLLPFATRYRPVCGDGEGRGNTAERMQVGLVGSATHKGAPLGLGRRMGRVDQEVGSTPDYALLRHVV